MVDTKTIVQTINYILKKTGRIDKLKIVKLVYLADKMHLMLYGRTITGDSYCVMKNGPVGSTTLDILNENLEFLEDSDIEYSKKFLTMVSFDSKLYEATNAVPEFDFLSESDQTVLDRIIALFAKKSSMSLVELTHKYPEWKQYESEFINQTRKHADIRIDELFSAIENDPLGIDPEQIKCSKEIFLGCE
ncbi:MAG: SocA family protein [Fibrobacter sp.]|nr:SocA family protein [Fibrobacter sp.]